MSNLSSLPQNSGVVICGHGSRAKIAEEEFSLLVVGIKQRFPNLNIEYGFLEYSSPNIHMALDRLIEKGVQHIYAVPGMLFAATHAKNDIPSVLTTYQEKHPGLKIEYGHELGIHEEMITAFQHRILEALGLSKIPSPGKLYDTMLVVVGRGTSVATANAEAAKMARIVTENIGFGWSETVYSGITFPSVGAGLEMAVKLGFKKIVVAPYFLFSGRLINRIYAYVDRVAAAHPDISFFKANYLRDHPNVIKTFIARIEEMISGCCSGRVVGVGLMDDFQARLSRGEVIVHHHHAEFQPKEESQETNFHKTNLIHNQQHNHSHDHSYGHGHAPYTHIAHPYGPKTMIDENICCCFMNQLPKEVIEDERRKKKKAGLIPSDDQQPQCKSAVQ